MLAHCVHCVYSGNRIRWIAPMLFSEFLAFLIHVVFCFVLPRDENRGGLFILAESLYCPYTGNRIRPLCFAPVIGFMGANPLCAEVHGRIVHIQWSVPSMVGRIPSVVPCPSPWFNDTTGGFFIWSDCRCIVVVAGKVSGSLTRGAVVPLIRRHHGAFSFHGLYDSESRFLLVMNASGSFSMQCLPFFFAFLPYRHVS